MEQAALQESPGRALWLDERRKGIGGTDAAAILGFSHYATEHDVWLAKRGLGPEKRDTEAMWWGRELEGLVARRYSEVMGFDLIDPESEPGRKRLVYHPDYPELIGSPDRLVVDHKIGLEVKTASVYNADDFGPPGTDQVPKSHLIQCAHYMAITGYSRWDLAALIGGSDFRIYHIYRDLAVEAALVSRLTEWWRLRIINGEPPPIDGSPSSERLVSARFPINAEPRLVATEEAERYAHGLVAAKAEVEEATKLETFYTAKLKETVGVAEGMDGSDWRVTWRSAKGRTYTDWEATARDLHVAYLALGGEEAIDEFQGVRTRVASGSRPFRFTRREKP